MEVLFKIGFFLLLALIGFWRGRRNERIHLAALAKEEERLREVLLFSSRYPESAMERLDPILVSGSAVMGSDFYRMLIGTLRKVVGGNYGSYERFVERGRRQALVSLKQQAHARGAKRVYNLMYSSSRISDPRLGQLPQFEVLAYGTAFIPAKGSVAESAAHHRASPLTALDGQTDLMKNKGSRPWVIGWFIAVFYAMAELMGDGWGGRQWRYVFGAPTTALFACGAIGTLLIAIRARLRHRLGWGETIILSFLTVPAIAAALYFACFRINALTAGAPQSVTYTATASPSLAPPLDSPFPKLDLSEANDYWRAQAAGSKHKITLARGWLSFWQYDAAPLRERYRSWSPGEDAQRNANAKKKAT